MTLIPQAWKNTRTTILIAIKNHWKLNSTKQVPLSTFAKNYVSCYSMITNKPQDRLAILNISNTQQCVTY